MNAVNIYCCRDGDYLLSPDCMQPSITASLIHGPLTFLGSTECLAFGDDLCQEIERQFESRMFALVARDRIDLSLLPFHDQLVIEGPSP